MKSTLKRQNKRNYPPAIASILRERFERTRRRIEVGIGCGDERRVRSERSAAART